MEQARPPIPRRPVRKLRPVENVLAAQATTESENLVQNEHFPDSYALEQDWFPDAEHLAVSSNNPGVSENNVKEFPTDGTKLQYQESVVANNETREPQFHNAEHESYDLADWVEKWQKREVGELGEQERKAAVGLILELINDNNNLRAKVHSLEDSNLKLDQSWAEKLRLRSEEEEELISTAKQQWQSEENWKLIRAFGRKLVTFIQYLRVSLPVFLNYLEGKIQIFLDYSGKELQEFYKNLGSTQDHWLDIALIISGFGVVLSGLISIILSIYEVSYINFKPSRLYVSRKVLVPMLIVVLDLGGFHLLVSYTSSRYKRPQDRGQVVLKVCQYFILRLIVIPTIYSYNWHVFTWNCFLPFLKFWFFME